MLRLTAQMIAFQARRSMLARTFLKRHSMSLPPGMERRLTELVHDAVRPHVRLDKLQQKFFAEAIHEAAVKIWEQVALTGVSPTVYSRAGLIAHQINGSDILIPSRRK